MTCKQCKNFQRCMDEAFSLEQVFDPNYDGEYGCLDFSVLTNADRIRAMSDEELHEFLYSYKFCEMCEEGCEECHYHGDCELRLADWLRQPVKDGDNDD